MSIDDRADEGRKRRDAAIEELLIYRKTLIDGCRQAMVALWKEREATTTPWVSGDDACEWLDDQACEVDYRLIGAVFRPKTGWQSVGVMYSRLARRHHREIKCWRWTGGA